MVHYLAIKKNKNFAICSDMDRPWRHYAKWNKSDRERKNTVYHLYVESKKYDKLVNKTEKKYTHRYGEQISAYQREKEGWGAILW